jgi:serine/threonine protein kinase
VDTIDKGGFGEVFKAYKIQSHSSNQDVAIKKSKIPTGDEKRKIPDPRIEALILKDLCKMQDARQVIVEYYDSFTEDGFHYLVMEYCPYGSIYEYLLKERRNPYTEDHSEL